MKAAAAAVTDEYLVQEFKKQVNNQKFLVVLQDLSSMAEWDATRKYLPNRSRGSRVLVSTQEFVVADFCTVTRYMQWFSADHSLYLLQGSNRSGKSSTC